jgi:hypothetical protein
MRTFISERYTKDEWLDLVVNNRAYAEELILNGIKPDPKPSEMVYFYVEQPKEIKPDPPKPAKFHKVNPFSGITFSEYSKMVWKITNEQPLHLLPNYKKRGFKNYHLDHRISIWLGWKSSIDPSVIGDFTNLKMIPAKENLTKGRNGKG